MNILSTRLRRAIESPTTTVVKPVKAFHPSAASIEINNNGIKEIVGSCLRQQYYKFTEPRISNKQNPDYVISANIGDKLHQLVADYIYINGFSMGLQKLDEEHSFYDEEFNISGRSDILAWDSVKNEAIGIEVKSVGEYKAGKCCERPDPQHVMQAMLYLHIYDKQIPNDMKKPKKWYIWYISRTENWTLKAKKHGSPLVMMWDYYITLENGIPNIYTAQGVERWQDYTVDKILARYKTLETHLSNKEIPPRDYSLKYSEEQLLGLYKQGKISTKMNREKIEKWVSKGAKEGMLKIDLGDIECIFCPWKDHCWELGETPLNDLERFNFPKTQIQQKREDTGIL